jgi:hypothetical protein
MWFFDYLNETKDGLWIDMKISKRRKDQHVLSHLSGVLVEKVQASIIYSASLAGTEGGDLSGVVLQDVHLKLLEPNHIARDSGE